MKLEPLKNMKGEAGDYIHDIKVHRDEDIKSAVEWLKYNINRDVMYDFDAGSQKGKTDKLLKLIDKAFEDVMKK